MPEEERDLSQFEEPKTADITPPPVKTKKEREEEKARKIAELEEEQRLKREEEKRQKEIKERKLKRQLITPGVALVICLICSLTMFLMKFDNYRMLKWLLGILVVSCIVGRLIQYMFDRFAKQNEEAVSDEGEVINKGAAGTEKLNGEADG